MGFAKRFITKEFIENTPKELLVKIFNSDVLILDQWSSEFYEKFKKENKEKN